MKTKLSKGMLMSALICGAIVPVLCGGTSAYAAEAETNDALNSFELNPMIITAQRIETKDLDTPASVEIIDEERIEKSGAANAFDVLQNTLGAYIQSQGFNGTSMGTMTSRIIIRGVDKGTLVLVNGVPMNQDGKYNLDDIPTESIERIEVVRGGGSVLYGSQATGGVVNIITKTKYANSVSVAAGNFGKERYKVSVGADKFNLVAGLENRGFAGKMSGFSTTGSTTVYDYGKGERKSVMWNYQIADGLKFTHGYSKNKNRYHYKNGKTNTITQLNDYEDTDNNFFLNYDKNGWKATIAYGTQEKQYDKTTTKTGIKALNSWRKGHNTFIDVQKAFNIGQNKWVIGASLRKEDMDLKGTDSDTKKPFASTLKRSDYSIYTSYDWKINEKSNLIFNARETISAGNKGQMLEEGKQTNVTNKSITKFTPEVEFIHRINDHSSLYAKAGKSFKMPDLTKIYGSGLVKGKLDLKPEQGTHFEVGYKLNEGNRAWRLALFNYKIKDSIEPDPKYNSSGVLESCDYYNADVKNTGIELSVNIEHDNHWSSNLGFTYNNPQMRDEHTYGDNKWHDYYGKYQIIGGINYKKGKFNGSLSGNFVGDRTAQIKAERPLKPQFFTNLHLIYKPEANHKFFFHLNNIFDRLDITSNSTSNFYTLGRNFMAGYEFTF